MKSKLSRTEFSICLAVWIAANAFILFKLYESQNEIIELHADVINYLSNLEPGWDFLARWKDTTDLEWAGWKYFILVSWPYLLIQFVVSELLRQTKTCNVKYWYITSSVVYISHYMGYKPLRALLLQPLLFSWIIWAGYRKRCVWLTALISMITVHSVKYLPIFSSLLGYEDLYEEDTYLILFCIKLIQLRCISYCIDYLDRSDKSAGCSKLNTLVDLFSYCLYLPYLFTGPLIMYENYRKSFDEPNHSLSTRIKWFIWDMSIFMFYAFMLDLALHYIYFLAMAEETMLIETLPILALFGAGMWMGYEFHVKYVVAYGMTNAFAKLDNMETPPTPRCIARIHVYSQMWRYFDVSLHEFLVKYIYKPSLEVISKWSTLPQSVNKILASSTTFAFIFLWHGRTERLLVWSLMNFLGIIVEYLAKDVAKTSTYKWFKENVLQTEEMETRFIAVMCVPLLTMSAVSNYYLFADVSIGDIYFENFLKPTFSWSMLFVFISLYCCCIVSKALEDFPSRTEYKKEKIEAIEREKVSRTEYKKEKIEAIEREKVSCN